MNIRRDELRPLDVGPLEPDAIEHVVQSVMDDHLLRKTLCQELPLERRGKNPIRRPKTALIARAAQETAEAAAWAEGEDESP